MSLLMSISKASGIELFNDSNQSFSTSNSEKNDIEISYLLEQNKHLLTELNNTKLNNKGLKIALSKNETNIQNLLSENKTMKNKIDYLENLISLMKNFNNNSHKLRINPKNTLMGSKLGSLPSSPSLYHNYSSTTIYSNNDENDVFSKNNKTNKNIVKSIWTKLKRSSISSKTEKPMLSPKPYSVLFNSANKDLKKQPSLPNFRINDENQIVSNVNDINNQDLLPLPSNQYEDNNSDNVSLDSPTSSLSLKTPSNNNSPNMLATK